MTSSLLLHLHLLPPPSSPPSLLFSKLQTPSQLNSISLQIHKPRRFSISASSSDSSSWEKEETRWLREEQRWMREEQRWVREESRWNSERESLLQQISTLKNRIQSLEQQNGGSFVPDTMSNLVKVLKEVDLSSVNQNRIAETRSGPVPIELESEKEEVKEVVVKDISFLENRAEEAMKKKKVKMIRKGSEGDEVRAMQEALLKLGFYSGEEDMEFSNYSSGTERAIKTWQASIGVPEDGNMTAELLERLFIEQETVDDKNSISTLEKESENGVSVASVTEVSTVKKIVVKENGDSEVGASHPRVFLLGENRWEDSSRLIGNKQVGESMVGISTTKCLSCHGVGRMLCTECDGTGEPNVESQFLEWVEEGSKCPYCEGLGYEICDVCEGKTIINV